MKKIVAGILIAAMGLSLVACAKDAEKAKSKSKKDDAFQNKIESLQELKNSKQSIGGVDAEDGWWEEYGLSENDVILQAYHSNFAWGAQYGGSFVTANGNVYQFDFSESVWQDGYNEIEEMQKVIESTDPVKTFDLATTKELFLAGYGVDTSERMPDTHLACDAGEDCIEVYVKDKGLTLVFEVGDNYGFYNEASVGKIVRFCYEELSDSLPFRSWFEIEDLP